MSGELTPEAAAQGDIPERFARVLDVAIAPWGEHAVVLLETNEPPAVELYQVVCERRDGRWLGDIGGNGPGQTWFAGGNVVTDWRQDPIGGIALAAVWTRDE